MARPKKKRKKKLSNSPLRKNFNLGKYCTHQKPKSNFRNRKLGDFPAGPVAKTPCSQLGRPRFNPSPGKTATTTISPLPQHGGQVAGLLGGPTRHRHQNQDATEPNKSLLLKPTYLHSLHGQIYSTYATQPVARHSWPSV